MTFTLGGTEFDIKPAKTKSILAIENKLGKGLSQIGNDIAFSDIVVIVQCALQQDNDVADNWIEENKTIAEMSAFTEVMNYFLAIPS